MMVSCNNKNKKEEADLIVHNGVVYTVDEHFSVADAFAVKNGSFTEVGGSEKILNKYTSSNIVDLQGAPVYPGFIDAHCHFLSLGLGTITGADLRGTASVDEIISRIREHQSKHPSEWIRGRGWDQNDWETKGFPSKEILDMEFPDSPVFLVRIDGHAAWVNSEALRRAGISGRVTIEGGEVMMKDGEATGILIDNAMELVRKAIPDAGAVRKAEALKEAEKICFGHGLTTVIDAGLTREEVGLIDSLHEAGELKIKINAMLTPEKENLDRYVVNGPYITQRLFVQSVKMYADGALGSRGALLLEPYSDDPDNRGILVTPADSIREICSMAVQNGYAVNTHAIGDAAVRLALNIYGEFLEGQNDKRWRIEHAQVVHPDDFDLFGRFSIIPSVQPTHATSDMYWAEERLGPERIRGAYAFRELLLQNGWIPLGTDFPVEKVDPLHTFYAAVARKDLEGYPEGGFQPENALTREQTLRGMTVWAARSGFMEKETGSIEQGKAADFIITDRNLMTIPIEDIPSVKIGATYILGEKVD
mgnify:FL=1